MNCPRCGKQGLKDGNEWGEEMGWCINHGQFYPKRVEPLDIPVLPKNSHGPKLGQLRLV